MKTKTKIVNISTIVQHRDLNYLFVVRTQKMIIEISNQVFSFNNIEMAEL